MCFPYKATPKIDSGQKAKLNGEFKNAVSELKFELKKINSPVDVRNLASYILNDIRDTAYCVKNNNVEGGYEFNVGVTTIIFTNIYYRECFGRKLPSDTGTKVKKHIQTMVNVASNFRANNATEKDYKACLEGLPKA